MEYRRSCNFLVVAVSSALPVDWPTHKAGRFCGGVRQHFEDVAVELPVENEWTENIVEHACLLAEERARDRNVLWRNYWNSDLGRTTNDQRSSVIACGQRVEQFVPLRQRVDSQHCAKESLLVEIGRAHV